MMIYFIEAETGHIKIGFTKDVKALKSRYDSLNSASPVMLSLLGVLHEGDREVEQRLHQRFRFHRYKGEWFLPSVKREIFATFPFETMKHQLEID